MANTSQPTTLRDFFSAAEARIDRWRTLNRVAKALAGTGPRTAGVGEDPKTLLGETETAIRGKDQLRAAALVARYGQRGHDPRPVFDLLLKFATSEDGALHAEKYYNTVTAEFAATRPAYRWGQLVALARVTASEYGYRSAGYDEAKKLLGV